jgi:hypothetical protein
LECAACCRFSFARLRAALMLISYAHC